MVVKRVKILNFLGIALILTKNEIFMLLSYDSDIVSLS